MEAADVKQLNLSDAGIAENVVKLARYLSPRTLWEMIRDCEGSEAAVAVDCKKVLQEYVARVWPAYTPTVLPADPYMTVEGRFYGTYGPAEYAAEYLQQAPSIRQERQDQQD